MKFTIKLTEEKLKKPFSHKISMGYFMNTMLFSPHYFNLGNDSKYCIALISKSLQLLKPKLSGNHAVGQFGSRATIMN